MQRKTYSIASWLVIIGFALLALSGWQRLAVSLPSWYWLANAGSAPGPLYLAISGAVWGLVSTGCVLWLLFKGRAYRWVGLGTTLFLYATFWLDRLWFARADGLGANLVFAILSSTLALACAVFILRPWKSAD